MTAPTGPESPILEVDEKTFEHEVIERSRDLPVVVDFWAAWCVPCRTLGPILERLAKEHAGRFVLAKVNVDASPRLASQFDIQGIPAVKAFRNGHTIAEFVGAQPAPAVRKLIETLLPNALETLTVAGEALLAAGDVSGAQEKYAAVLAQDAEHPGALLGMGRVHLAMGREDMGLETLARVPTATPQGPQAARLRSETLLRRTVADSDELSLRAQIEASPSDLDAHFKLAGLLTLDRRYQEALEEYLELVRRNRSFRNDGARLAMLHIFEVLGEDPLVRTYRQRLAIVLF